MKICDESAERDVLAAILIRRGALSDIQGIVGPDAFGLPASHAIASAIWAIADARGEVTIRAVERELVRQRADGIARGLLDELVRHRPQALLAQARRLRDIGVARRCFELLHEITDEHERAADAPAEWLDDVARRVTAAADVRRDLELVPMASLVDEHQRVMEARGRGVVQGVPTGLDVLDAMTGGLQVGEVTVLAARPSFGKSALALQIGNAVSRSEPFALFSSEMKRIPVLDRVLAESGDVDMGRMRRGRLESDEWQALSAAYDRLRNNRNAYVSDRRGWRINEIVAQVRQWKRLVGKARPDGSIPQPVVAIDYLQRVRPSSRHGSREQEVAEVSDTIATMAGEVGVAVLLLAQLNRMAEGRGADEEPQLADLRESGSVEQDADNVWFVHRPDRIDSKIERGAATICIRKQRQGEVGSIPCWFRGNHQRFELRDRDYTRSGEPEKTSKPRTRKPPARPSPGQD